MLLFTLSFSSMICYLYAASWCWMSYSPFSFRVDQRFTSSWLNLRRHSSHFSNRLTVILETFLHPETFLWETLITRLQSIIRVYRGDSYTLSVAFPLCRRALEDCGTLWRKLPLSSDLESYSWLHSATRWHGRSYSIKVQPTCEPQVNLTCSLSCPRYAQSDRGRFGVVLQPLWVNIVCLILRWIPVEVSVLSIVFVCFENWRLLYHVRSLIYVFEFYPIGVSRTAYGGFLQIRHQCPLKGWCD